jgi:outer membrane receptor protein involved in Fe transport
MEQSPFFFKHTDTSHSLYARDRWRVTPKLTVNYGLRWDLFLTAHESYDRMSAFDPTVPNPAAGGLPGALTFWGNGAARNGRHQLVDPVYKNFGPRLGLAYQLDSRTVARAYYGIQYFMAQPLKL